MQILRLSLPSRDLAAAARFYGETLGLTVEKASGQLDVRIGDAVIEFFPGDALPQHFAFNVRASAFEAAKAWLAERLLLHQDAHGHTSFDFPSWNAQGAYFRDPDGNVLEIIARRTRPWEGIPNGHPLIELSEVGIACADVPRAAESLGLPIYGEASPSFTAVGDEEGLLILVQAGRLWYPDTGVPATAPDGFVRIREAGADREIGLRDFHL